METISPRRISLTTWVVLGLCVAAGVIAVAMTAVVIVRLNRQVLASAAELRASLGPTVTTPGDPAKAELLQYAGQLATIEAQWAETVADYRLRYPTSAFYESVATAQAMSLINAMRRPPAVATLHERWAQAWSDRDAAVAILARPSVDDAGRAQAAELGRRAADELRRARNELRDLLLARGVTDEELATARLDRA